MSLPALDSEPVEFLEWLEVVALLSENGQVPLVSVAADLEVEEEEEPDEMFDEDRTREDILSAVRRIVYERSQTLGEAYPFDLIDGHTLALHGVLNTAQELYLYSLLVTHGSPRGVLGSCLDLSSGGIRDLFEAVVSVALSGVTQGPSYVIGTNRRGGDGFLAKLRNVYERMADGVVVAEVPDGAPAMPKDDGVDVVSWSNEATPAPRARYYTAQAATGENWIKKTTKVDADRWHNRWFRANSLLSSPMACTAIPFDLDWWLCVHGGNLAGAGDRPAEVRMGFLAGNHGHLGVVFDRAKLVEFALAAPSGEEVTVEGLGGLDSIRQFIGEVRTVHTGVRP